MASKNKEPSYGLIFGISTILTLALHYFLISKISLHPTIHVALSMLIFVVIIGILSEILKRKH